MTERYRLLLLLIGLCACTAPDAETARVRAHLEDAYAEVAARSVPELTATQRAARTRLLADLRAYIDAEDYPTNDVVAHRTPIFVDRFGTRCAMAALIEASDHEPLVARIAHDHLYAYIPELADDPELLRWLDDHGLTLADAARIQPSYDNRTEASWRVTANVGVSTQVGLNVDDDDLDLWGLVNVRAGVRRVVRVPEGHACDDCTYRSTALVAEYERLLAPDGANLVGALVEHDIGDDNRSIGLYIVGGPIAELRDSLRYGGKLGFGVAGRSERLPLFGEVSLSGLDYSAGFAAHIGVAAGIAL